MKTILVDAVNTFVLKDQGIFRDMYELLEEYPNNKIILTNADDEQMETFGLHDMPYDVFTLKHNPEKTDSVFYETMLKQFDLSADEVVYFEHNHEAVASAQSKGIKTLHYDKDAKDLEAVKEFLDENLAE